MGSTTRHAIARSCRKLSELRRFCANISELIPLVETGFALAESLNLMKLATACTAATGPTMSRGRAKVVGFVNAPRTPKPRQRAKRLRVGRAVHRTKAITNTRLKNVAAYSI